MNKTEFTAGPWATYNDHTDPLTASRVTYIRAVNRAHESDEIAILFGCDMQEQVANAQLMSAAPELFEALQKLIAVAEPNLYPCPDKPNSSCGILQQAKAAIAKALDDKE